MLMQSRPLGAIVVILAAAATQFICIGACGAAITLDIGAASGSTGETIEVPVTLSGSPAASTIVFGVAFDPQALQFISAVEGSALGQSQWVEQGTVSGGVAPIAVSSLAYTIPGGEICIVSFKILSGDTGVEDLTGSGTPSAASLTGSKISVVLLGGEVVANCTGSGADAPSGVTASTNQATGVMVSWNPTAGASAHRVYRASASTPDAVEAVSDWMAGVRSWLDTTAAPPGVLYTMGCQAPGDTIFEKKYIYWVRARDEAGCPGDYSEPAEGWRTLGKTAVLSAGLFGARAADTSIFAAVAMILAAGAAIKNRFSRNNP